MYGMTQVPRVAPPVASSRAVSQDVPSRTHAGVQPYAPTRSCGHRHALHSWRDAVRVRRPWMRGAASAAAQLLHHDVYHVAVLHVELRTSTSDLGCWARPGAGRGGAPPSASVSPEAGCRRRGSAPRQWRHLGASRRRSSASRAASPACTARGTTRWRSASIKQARRGVFGGIVRSQYSADRGAAAAATSWPPP